MFFATDIQEPERLEDTNFKKEARARFIHTFLRYPGALPALILLAVIVLSAILAPVLTPYTPLDGSAAERLRGIGTAGHLLGTDEQGRDILTRCLYGGRYSLLMGFLPVALATVVGSILGIISGYFGKAYAQIVMRTLDVFYAFPSILLAIALSSVLGYGLTSIVIPIAIILVPPIARVAESTVQDIMPEDYVEAAQTSGASALKIIVFFIIPNAFGRVFIYCTTQFSVSILSASGLSFLGLGISPPTPEWGSMLNALRQQIFINPVLTIVPGLFILATALSVNIISDGLKDALEATG
ncbi:MAG: ABC transporter permease [Clostridia bacterium]|nr:ABC transporter permease [Clostridia bacterium]